MTTAKELSSQDQEFPVLRSIQLDTTDLDQTLMLNLRELLNQDLFKYVQLNYFQKYNIELFALVKFLIWYNTFYKNSQTVSQSIFDWAYRGQTRTKLILHGVIYCLDEWLENVLPHLVKRVYSLLLKFFFAKKTKQVNEENEELNNSRRATSVINYFITVYRLAKFINYLVFLYQGKYCHLWERLLQLRPVYKKPPAMRTFNHDVTMREVLWQSYFSVFTLLDRVFNLRKLMRNFATKVSRTSTSRANTKVDDCLLCAICESEPIAVHRSINRGDQNACKHVFCYICAKRELLDKDGKFNCPVCSKLIFDIELFIQSQIL